MAYGTPESPDHVEAYFTHIRGGRAPSDEAVHRLQRRYQLVGGRTPLLDITNGVRDALERELNARGNAHRVYVGMKHWHPFIGDVVPHMAADGVTEAVALALAPHYSRISIGGYRQALDAALAGMAHSPSMRFINSWHMHDGFIDLIAERVIEALGLWGGAMSPRAQVVTVFTAHSLPERIREWDDPYEQQLQESCRAVAERAGINNWIFAWQSAGETGGEKWLGPDICDALETIHDAGSRNVLSVPIGFVSDHLEILYDIDYEARRKAASLGMTLRRTRMPNVDPAFVNVLASVVTGATPATALAS
jgi:ferrochelatase